MSETPAQKRHDLSIQAQVSARAARGALDGLIHTGPADAAESRDGDPAEASHSEE